MDETLDRLARAYDRTVELHRRGISPLDELPRKLVEDPAVVELLELGRRVNSGDPALREHLDRGGRLLDVGCCANLANYRLDRWSTRYHGVDIAGELLGAMAAFVRREGLEIGGLIRAEAARLPFTEDSFNAVAVIGVCGYLTMDYTVHCLDELERVTAPGGRLAVDLPDTGHRLHPALVRLGRALERPPLPVEPRWFEERLRESFEIHHRDEGLIIRWLLRKRGKQ